MQYLGTLIMYKLINTIEIALLILLPLIIFYRRSIWSYKMYVFIIPVLYLIWYLSYGLMHELSHMAGIWMSGKELFDYQLMPHFWKGDYGTGFVNYDFKGNLTDLCITILPYIRDIVLLIIGFVILKKKIPKQSFITGLILLLLVLSSLYDVSNNYLAYLMGSLNDFNAITIAASGLFSNLAGISFIITAFFLTIRIMILSKGYPQK
jgi:hypothetical protein